jgi:hypothetical protein
LITGTLATVMGFDVVIIVIFAGGVVLTTGSILIHFVPFDADPP